MKLVQKHFLKGTREFEIADDVVNVRFKTPFKEEKFTVMLTILNPEPVVNEQFLEFHSRVKCGPLMSLLINKPNAEKFNAFVNELKQRARQEYNALPGSRLPLRLKDWLRMFMKSQRNLRSRGRVELEKT